MASVMAQALPEGQPGELQGRQGHQQPDEQDGAVTDARRALTASPRERDRASRPLGRNSSTMMRNTKTKASR